MALLVAACETHPYEAVGPGGQAIGGGMSVTKTAPWVRITPALSLRGPNETWTIDGLGLNMLLMFSGIEDGQALSGVQGGAGVTPPPVFSHDMDGLELEELVAATVSLELADGIAVETTSLRPVDFMGAPGFEMEFAYPASDGLEMRGYASGANVEGKLYMILFVAPRLHYYGKDIVEVRAIAASARRV